MQLLNLALRLLRIAGEVIFCFEVNRFLGRAVKGPICHRLKCLQKAESTLLQHVNAKTVTTTVTLPCGLRIHTLIAGNIPTASQNTLVLLHGHSMAGAFWFRNIDTFLDMGYTTIYIPDLPGWGRSSRPKFRGDVENAVSFFLDPIKHWADALQLSSFTLCGHSLGAYISHEFAQRFPERVSKLIMTAPAAIMRHTNLSMALWFALTPQRFLTHGGLLANIIFAIKYPSHHAYNMNGFRDLILLTNSVSHRSGDAAAARLLRFWRKGRFSWRSECVRPLLENVTKLQCPVQIITGDCDVLVNVEAVRALYRAMVSVGNSVRLQVIPGADHSPHICSPATFAKALLRTSSSLALHQAPPVFATRSVSNVLVTA